MQILQCSDASADSDDRCASAANDIDREFDRTKNDSRVCTLLYAHRSVYIQTHPHSHVVAQLAELFI